MDSIKSDNLFTINKLPTNWGLLIFPISMSRIANSQSPDECLEYIRIFNPSKLDKPTIGVHFLYGESLYTAYETESTSANMTGIRNKHIEESRNHKNRMQKLVNKFSTTEFQIPEGFNYQSWDDCLLNTASFSERFRRLKEIYHSDTVFKKYIADDCAVANKTVSEAQVNFFLEEHLLTYLIQKGECRFHNNHVQGREEWTLWCYPGQPPKALVYLFQLNPFNLNNPTNKYQDCVQYNLLDQKLYDATRIELT